MEFIDDYRLLAIFEATQSEPLSLVLIDTEKDIGGPPIKTVFLLPLYISNLERMHLHLEQGGHEPSPAESLALFHQDPSQHIAVLDVKQPPFYLVFLVGALLEFEDCGGSEISWDGWKSCVVIPFINLNQLMHSEVRVSGSHYFLSIKGVLDRRGGV